MTSDWHDFEVKVSSNGHEWVLEWEWIGEGNSGDYNPDDPEDVPRLRATLKVDGKQVADGSYCTLATTSTPREELEKTAQALLNTVCGHEVRPGPYENEVYVNKAKRIMEAWTWVEYSR